MDTNIVIYLLAGGSKAARFAPFIEGNIGALGFQTVAELRYAALRRGYGEGRRAALERLIRRFTILLGDEATTDHWAILKREAEGKGKSKSCEDLWIAASARRHDLPLLTSDTDFFAALDVDVIPAPPA